MNLSLRPRCCAGALLTVSLHSLVAAGCAKEPAPPAGRPEAMAPAGDPPGGDRPGGGGRRGRRGGRGGRGEPIAPTASAGQIYQQRCQGCHGDQGQGGRGGVPLADAKQKSAGDLKEVIRSGRNRMPAFAGQMTNTQLDALAAYVRKL